MRLAKRDTVIVTKEGNKLVRAGDIVEEAIADADVIDSVSKIDGPEPREKSAVWASGRPLKIVIGDIQKVVSINRRDHSMGDMDCVLPQKILVRRKKLVYDRMKQEKR